MSSVLLQVESLCVHYGKNHVVRRASLQVRAGELVALLGPNGAGKTTVLRTLSRLKTASAGRVLYDGWECGEIPAHRLVARGLVHAPEGRQVFGEMTVAENLQVGSFAGRLGGPQRRARWAEILDLFPVLGQRLRQQAGTLSGGEQQMLAMGRALMAGPRLLLLDEPTLGLAPKMTRIILDGIVASRALGTAILMVEQNANLALDIADRAYVMDSGSIDGGHDAQQLRRSGALETVFFGHQENSNAS